MALTTITATVNDSSGKPVATGSWKCSDHGGSMTGLPSGSGFTLQLDGLSGTVKAWSATKTGIALSTSAPADAGTVALTYAASAAFTKAIVTLAATGATSSNQIISCGATVGIPVGVSLSADATGEPASGVLTKASTLSTNSYITGKYTAPTAASAGNIVLGTVDSAGFGAAIYSP
jgi:hypothetical protein